jgi:TolB-like protein/Tfp pilus assembly protein PilF
MERLTAAKAKGWDALATADIFLFEEFRLDRREDGLSRLDKRGVFVPISIGLRALDVLAVLVERSGNLVTKEEIMAAVWGRTVVENANLTVQISALRRVLDQGRSEEGSCIQTVAARGYRFVIPVTRVERAKSGRAVAPEPVAPRLSIVVLPFANLSDDRQQQYFADGITDDLTTDLSRLAGMFVIARNTAFTYKDKPIDAKQIGRELGVRYVLKGSVRRSGSQVRVNAQLVDAETDAHLWAERFDRDTADLFALQDEITGRIAIALDLALVDAEAARPTEHPDALDYILRGRAALAKPATRENYAEAIDALERALALHPRSAEAQGFLAVALSGRVMIGWAESAAADIARAEGLVGQALAAAPRSATARAAKGQVLRAQGRYAEAIPEYEMAIAINRNRVGLLFALGQCKLFAGSIDEVIPLVEQAIRLSPRDPLISAYYSEIGFVHLLQSRTDEAMLWFENARNANPEHPGPHGRLAAAYALNCETERAAAELAEARRLSGDGRFASIARLKAARYFRYWGVPKIRDLFETTFFAGLRKLGVPEE